MNETDERGTIFFRVGRGLPLLVVAIVTSLGCKDPTSGGKAEGETTGAETETGEELTTTYWQDVAPIYYERCVTCHREDGIAPFRLDIYEIAAEWAQVSASSVETRQMPPWLLTDDGTCNEWQDSHTLSQAQIDTILAWVDAGAPEGEPRDDLVIPELPGLTGELTTVMTPVFEPEPGDGALSQNDEYRCFLLDPQLSTEQFLTGYQVTPGNDALIHHVIGLFVDPERIAESGQTNLEVIEGLDAESPDRLGWPCFALNADFELESLPVVWAPGQGAVDLPANSGQRIAAGNLMVVQVHYNMADPSLVGQTDTTEVSLRFEDQVEREGRFDIFLGLIRTLLAGDPYLIPPGEAAHEYTFRLPGDMYTGWIGEETVDLWGFFPHMHQRGVRMSATVFDDQGQEVGCLAELPRWDEDWQLYYFLDEPIVIEPGYEIEVTCTYDTTNDAGPIIPGWGTNNEMCFVGLYLTRG